ncbi:MAG: hypothetical protein AAF334_10120, partial [Pseudomonadota bacterium]
QAAIRRGKEGAGIEDTLTLSDLRAAIRAIKDIESQMAPEASTPEVPRPSIRRAPKPETSVRSVGE